MHLFPTDPAQQVLMLSTIAGLGIIYLAYYLLSPLRHLPPGPRGLPILGNLFQLIGRPQWVIFAEWYQRYGDLVYLNVAGQRIIVMNSPKVSSELLERRSAKYSDRPRNIVAAELLTGGLFFVFTGYTEIWRRMRKGAHEALHKGSAHRYHPTQLLEAILLCDDVLRHPDRWMNYMRRSAASSVMSIVYDSPTITTDNDPSVLAINDMVSRLTRAALPGAHLVEFFPWMKHIPARLAKWKREAQMWFVRDTAMFQGFFDTVRKRLLEGDHRPSITATLIEGSDRLKLSQDESTWLAATMYAAGAETTAGVLTWWMHAMVLNPGVQEKAQKELDVVVGRDRIPTFADRDKLPYIQAIVKESLRLRPVDPLGMPHCTTEEDWYNGMYIPKGTVCIANVWCLNRDPNTYGPDASEFNPDRYLRDDHMKGELVDAQEEGHFTYGFGRRICIGRHVANNSLFMDIALLLWAMRIERASEVDVDGCIDHGLVVGPVPFSIKVTPRFPEVAMMLEEEREHWKAR